MFVAARVSSGSEVVQPRRMVKVGPDDTCGLLLQTLLEKAGATVKYSIDSIAAFTDVKELDASKIKLEVSDDMSNIIDLGYKFFLFDIVLQSDPVTAIGEAPPPQPVIECSTPHAPPPVESASSQGIRAPSVQTPSKSTPNLANLERSQEPQTDSSEKSESLHYMCVCGRSVLHSTRQSHEKYCSAYKAWTAAERSRAEAATEKAFAQNENETDTAHPFKCECGSGFDDKSHFDDHCKTCDTAANAIYRCCCGKYFASVDTHSRHIPHCPKCRRCAKASAFPEYYKKYSYVTAVIYSIANLLWWVINPAARTRPWTSRR